MPIIAEADLPARLRETCQTIADWNNAQLNGWYMASNALNAPVANTWFMGTVTSHGAAGWYTQEVHAFTTDSTLDTKSYRRDSNNGIWGSWYRIRQSEAELDLRFEKIFDSINGGSF